jgi:hypothetical protein
MQAAFTGAMVLILLFASFIVSKFIKRSRTERRLRLPGDEVSGLEPKSYRVSSFNSTRSQIIRTSGPSVIEKRQLV